MGDCEAVVGLDGHKDGVVQVDKNRQVRILLLAADCRYQATGILWNIRERLYKL